MTAAPRRLEQTLRSFADRLFLTGGRDPGDGVLALPPSRLALYRGLLHSNYSVMLRFAFTQSFALMDRELAAAAGASGLPPDADAIVTRFLQVSPSRSHSIREIADRFLVFLPREVPALCARRSDLIDLMTLERAELRAMFAVDDPGRALETAEIEALSRGSLEDLLAREILRAPSSSVLRLTHPVVALRAALERGDEPSPAAAGQERVVVGRGAAPRFAIEFALPSAEAALVYEAAEPGVPVTAERLAQDWFAALPETARARDDAWKASTFAGALLDGLRCGSFRGI